jgi:hypothetical protein
MARFLLACSRNHIAFKATAGLHHPFRRPERLVPGAEGSGILMHGFMNLAIAAVLVHAGKAVEEEVAEVFEERSPEAFEITDGGIAWRGRMLDLREIGEARRRFFRSFGSCSFREPATGLEERGLV